MTGVMDFHSLTISWPVIRPCSDRWAFFITGKDEKGMNGKIKVESLCIK